MSISSHNPSPISLASMGTNLRKSYESKLSEIKKNGKASSTYNNGDKEVTVHFRSCSKKQEVHIHKSISQLGNKIPTDQFFVLKL